MKLVVEAKKKDVKPRAARAKISGSLRSAFLIVSPNKNINKIKEGSAFYPFIGDDGTFSDFGGIFSSKIDVTDKYKNNMFEDAADYVYSIVKDFEPSNQSLRLAHNTLDLKGTRLTSTYLDVRQVLPAKYEGEDAAVIIGYMVNAYDPRLAYLGEDEETPFGKGDFSLEKVLALYDGSYFYGHLSHQAANIEAVVERQKELIPKLAEDLDNTHLQAELERTQRLLKPHSNEIYKIEDDYIYYITKKGRWMGFHLVGPRKIDVFDRKRMVEFAKSTGVFDTDVERLRKNKETFHNKAIYEKFNLKDNIPLFLNAVKKTAIQDAEEVKKKIDSSNQKKPADGTNVSYPGLKPHVELFPHQALILSKLRERNRLMTDADPGAGKTLITLADISQQIDLGTIKRPLVVVPQSLVNQFASETRSFTEFNPWIITTQSIKKWKDGTIESMIADAKKAPPHTVFITSYEWLSRNYDLIPNGQLVKNEKGTIQYGEMKRFTRCYLLLNEVGIDAVYQDECHLLRTESNVSVAAATLAKTPVFRGLTGTIMPGNLIDVTGPMGVIHSGVLGSVDDFLDEFSQDKTINSYYADAPKKIRKKLLEFGTPQIRSTAWASLMPKVQREYHYVNFNAQQQKEYENLLRGIIEEIDKDPSLTKELAKFDKSLNAGNAKLSPKLLARFIPLEKFLNAPATAAAHLQVLLQGDSAISPKIKKINEITGSHLGHPNNGKVIIFTQFKETAYAIYKELLPNIKQVAAVYKAGNTDILNRFADKETPLKVLVAVDASLRLGHNLQAANCIIHADGLWLPGDMKQREARSARIKQDKIVYIHHILIQNSAELLKTARLLSMEHTIAKANSDFEDTEMLQPIKMSLDSMKSFRETSKLDPFIKKQVKHQKFVDEQKDKDKVIYGTSLIKPLAAKAIKVEKLKIVPSTKHFNGQETSKEQLVEEELSSLPSNPRDLKLIKFHLQNWNDNWLISAFKDVDPQGFLRRLNFKLRRSYLYKEIPNKGGLTAVMNQIERKGISIINAAELKITTSGARNLDSGYRGVIKDLMQEDRVDIKAAAAAEPLPVDFQFASIDGFPFVFTESVKTNSEEEQKLKSIGFQKGIPFWYLEVRRSTLLQLLKKIQHNFPELKIAGFADFSEKVQEVFKVNLKDFNELGVDKK